MRDLVEYSTTCVDPTTYLTKAITKKCNLQFVPPPRLNDCNSDCDSETLSRQI